MNDLGGGCDGTGKSSSEANNLVKQIEQSGGKAVPDYSKNLKRNHLIYISNLYLLLYFDRFG